MRVYVRVLSFTRYISDLVTYILCIDPIKSLSRTELLKASTAGSCMMSASFFMIRSSFLEIHINRTTVPVHRPLLGLNPDISHSKSIHSLRCSPINQNQSNLANSGYQILRKRVETTHIVPQLPKKINHHQATQRQVGDSQPFSPLELIAKYPFPPSPPTKCQQTGDNLAEKERNTILNVLDRDKNSVRVYDLIGWHIGR